jgi:hypothetical protein
VQGLLDLVQLLWFEQGELPQMIQKWGGDAHGSGSADSQSGLKLADGIISQGPGPGKHDRGSGSKAKLSVER